MLGVKRMEDPAAQAEIATEPSAREQRLARRFLVIVGGAYLLLQLVLFSYHRAPGWDESVYLSQILPGTKAMFFASFRARGITLLIAPAARLGGTVGAVRLSLVFLSTGLLIATFWIWIPVVGAGAAAAATLFGFSWLGLINGSEVYPNLWAALLGLAVAGAVARYLPESGKRFLFLTAVLLGVMALFRPTEATVVAIALGAYLLLARRASWRLLLALGLGLAAGWLPWVVEMSLRFDGPMNALREAGTAHFAVVSIGHNLVRYLAYTDARIMEPESNTVPLAGVLWWAWILVMAIVGFARSRALRGAILLCSIGALAFALEYVVFVSALAPRYLLPAYAFASVPAAVGVISLLRGGIVPRVAGAIAVLLVLPWAIWQGGVADRFEAVQGRDYASPQEVGRTIRQISAGRPCAVLSDRWYPEVALAAGCGGDRLASHEPTVAQLQEVSTRGKLVFMVLSKKAEPNSPLGHVQPVRSIETANRTWFIYEFSGVTGTGS
jgi:hypothetical protein